MDDQRQHGESTGKGESLCRTCRYAHIEQGHSGSEERILCGSWGGASPLSVRFPVKECSDYEDKRLPSLYRMEKVAWILSTRNAGNTIGFIPASRRRTVEDEDD
jgi:hypothetical protein